MSEHEFAVGDIVTWNAVKGGYGQRYVYGAVYGAVCRIDDMSASVRPEGGGRAVVHRRKSRIHDWPFRWVAKEQYARLLWARQQPECTVIVATLFTDTGLKVSAQIGRDFTKISTAIAELNALAQWLAKEPPP